jgi:hypothetical protein
MQIELPIFLLEKDCGDISKFQTIEEMQRQLEKIDIENHEYDAWDKNGLPLRLSVQKPIWLGVEIQSTISESDKVKHAITDFAARAGVDLKKETSSDLVNLFDRAVAEMSKRGGRK